MGSSSPTLCRPDNRIKSFNVPERESHGDAKVAGSGFEWHGVGCSGRAASSIDGQVWHPLDLEGCEDLFGVAGCFERIVGVGASGAILLPSARPATPVLSFKTPKSGIDGNANFQVK